MKRGVYITLVMPLVALPLFVMGSAKRGEEAKEEAKKEVHKMEEEISRLEELTKALVQIPAENLAPNPSFEQLDIKGMPLKWSWWPGRANATVIIDSKEAHSGKYSIKIINQTPPAPHVYSCLAANIPVKPNTKYTLSCYVKSKDPGVAWIGGGRDWRFRVRFPKTADKWQRVAGTYTTAEDEYFFQLMILTESPTEGFWVDSVQLEEGIEATKFNFRMPLEAGKTAIILHKVEVGTNLVPNSSFEAQLHGNRPPYWMFDKRNTDATLTVDDKVAHSGQRSIEITNGTAFSPHVYCWFGLVGGLNLKPNTTYTLSCYVKSEDPGIAWIGGGKDWRIRLRFPRTGGRWLRVQHTFTTLPDENSFPLMIISESPTRGFWVDDVKLEEGSKATFYIAEPPPKEPTLQIELPQPKLVPYRGQLISQLWSPSRYPPSEQIFVADELSVYTYFYTPNPIEDALVSFKLLDDTKKIIAAAKKENCSFQAGVTAIEFIYGSSKQGNTACQLQANIKKEGTLLASASLQFKLFTKYGIEEKLSGLKGKLAELNSLMANIKRKRIDISYQKVSATVLENFINYAYEDCAGGELTRAWDAALELDAMAERAIKELKAIAAGKRKPLEVPKYITSDIEIKGPSFIATTQKLPAIKKVRRPVFFVGYGHFGQVRQDVEKFPGYGINIIQIEFGPDRVFPEEGKVCDAAVKDFIQVCERAAKSNVAVNLLISPHYFPAWAIQKYPHLKSCQGGFLQFCIHAPESKDILERYLRYIIPKIKDLPALHSICLSNEPIYTHNNCQWVKALWQDWLMRKHKSIGELNAKWGTMYKNFEEITIPEPGFKPEPYIYDFVIFNQEQLADWHKWLAGIIHEMAPKLPLHAKIMLWGQFERHIHGFWSVDAELFGELSQINGNDCIKWYHHHGESGWVCRWQDMNMGYDFQLSMYEKPIFNSENHLIKDRDLEYIPPIFIKNVLWQGSIHGQSATTIWVWERTFDPTHDFAGSIMHRPACAEAVGKTCLDLNRLSYEVSALQNLKPKVLLLYSTASAVYSERHLQALSKAYEALNFMGIKLGFVTERQLMMGKKLKPPAVLVIPAATNVLNSTIKAIDSFIKLGGKLILISEDNFKFDEYNKLRQKLPNFPAKQCFYIKEITSKELFQKFNELWERLGIIRECIIIGADNNQPVYGLEYLSTFINKELIVNMVNYLTAPVKIKIVNRQNKAFKKLINLFTGEPIKQPLIIEPLEVLLIKVSK